MKKSTKPTTTGSTQASSTKPISGGPTGPDTAIIGGTQASQPGGIGGQAGPSTPNPSGSNLGANPAALSLGPQASTLPPTAVRPERPIKRGPSAATIIWGLIVLFVGVVLMAVALNVYLDVTLFAVVVLTLGGLALIAGAIRAATQHGKP